MPNGDIVTRSGTVTRGVKPANALYSSVFVTWLGPDPAFQVLSIQVKGAVGTGVTKPIPGRDYSNEASPGSGNSN
jgi:hypothetical protein